MKLNTRCRYGTRAMIEIAANYGAGPIKRKEMANNQNISDSYLETILIALKNSGLVRTVRGPDGGFTLTRKPSEITLMDIIKALEGSIAPVECVDDGSICAKSASCGARELWMGLYESQTSFLKSISLQDIVEKNRR